MSEVEELRAEVERLRAACIPLTDLLQELTLARENLRHSRAMSDAHFERANRERARAEAAEAEVERLREQVKQLQYDLLLGPKPAEVTPPAEHVIDVDMTGLNGEAL